LNNPTSAKNRKRKKLDFKKGGVEALQINQSTGQNRGKINSLEKSKRENLTLLAGGGHLLASAAGKGDRTANATGKTRG